MGGIKYAPSEQPPSGATKIGNFIINPNPTGPTSETGYWSTIDPPSGGYTIYLNKAQQGPSIYVPTSDSQLISLTRTISGQDITTVAGCIAYYSGNSDTALIASMPAPSNLLILGAFTSPDDRIWSTNFSGGTNTNFTNNIGTGFQSSYPLNAYRYLNGSKILLCGFFTSYNGNTANYFVELNTDGTFSRTGIGTGFNNSVRFIGVQSDNKIICAGTFTSYNGVSCNRVVRLNADFTIDGTFSIGDGIDNVVEGGVYDGIYVYLFGSFSTYKGTSCPKLAKIDSSGTLQSGVTTGFNGTWTHRGYVLGDYIYISGDNFTTYNGTSVPPRIVKLNKNTLTIDSTFSTNYSDGLNARVGNIESDGTWLYIGGNFTNSPRTYLAKVSFDGVGQTFPTTAPNGNTYFFYPFDNNTKLAFGGTFVDYAGAALRDRFAVVDASTGNVNTGWTLDYFGGAQVPVGVLQF